MIEKHAAIKGLRNGQPTPSGRTYPPEALQHMREMIAAGRAFVLEGDDFPNGAVDLGKVLGIAREMYETEDGVAVRWDVFRESDILKGDYELNMCGIGIVAADGTVKDYNFLGYSVVPA